MMVSFVLIVLEYKGKKVCLNLLLFSAVVLTRF